MSELIYPLLEHIPELEYPNNAYGWDEDENAPILEMDEDEIDAHLSTIGTQEGLVVQWCVEGLDQRYLDEPVTFPIVALRYGGFELRFPPAMKSEFADAPVSWLDLWRAVDALVRLCGGNEDNLDHRFLEGFCLVGDGVFEPALGS